MKSNQSNQPQQMQNQEGAISGNSNIFIISGNTQKSSILRKGKYCKYDPNNAQ